MKTIFSIVALVALINLGCKAEADRPADSKLPRPEKYPGGNLLLTESFDKTFNGSLLFWSPDVDAKHMARVVKASDNYLMMGVEKLQYVKDELLPIGNEILPRVPKLIALDSRGKAEYFKLSSYAAAGWFMGTDPAGVGGQLAEISQKMAELNNGQGLTPEEIGQAKNLMVFYCEAKLWQRAVFKTTLTDTFKRRPTPSALCEGVYQLTQAFPQDSDLCQDSPEGKSYFPCLWNALQRTKLYQMRYIANPDPQSVDTAVNLRGLKTDDLIAFFNHRTAKNDQKFLRQENLSIPTADGEVVNVSMKFKFDPARDNENKPTMVTNATILELIAAVEGNQDPEHEGLRILPRNNRSDAAQIKLLEEEALRLRQSLGVFNSLSVHKFVNEVRFNAPFRVNANLQVTLKDNNLQVAYQKFPSVFVVTSPELEAIKEEAGALKTIVMAAAAELQAKQAEITDATNCAADPETIACRFNAAAEESMASIESRKTSEASFQSSISLTKQADGGYKITVFLNTTTQSLPILGCVTANGENAGTTCLKNEEIDAAVNAESSSIDEETSRISVRASLKNAEALGLQLVEREKLRAVAGFNEIDPKSIQDKEIVINVGLNEVEGILTTMVGEAKIVKDNVDSHLGGIKFKDAMPPVQVEMENLIKTLEELQQLGK